MNATSLLLTLMGIRFRSPAFVFTNPNRAASGTTRTGGTGCRFWQPLRPFKLSTKIQVNNQFNLACSYFDPNSLRKVSATPPELDGFFGNAGRNILRGPGYFNLDMSLMRGFKITERFTFQFEASAFGVTNTPHFNNPNTNTSGANFGAVTSTLVTTNASLGGSGGQRQWWFGAKVLF